ncbi:hypothetical protein [Sphaerisporangium fuscum]|uniref:hypothetical protein n=1 Tax=Sphaerisporangium fuscum TaxID=2835868 RepID=UPI001BDBF1BC|nr:hypothetical protein [Sphaerisporangium fuscum]
MRALLSFLLAASLTAVSVSLAAAPAFPAALDDPAGPKGQAIQHDRTVGVVLRNSRIVLHGDGLGAKSDGYRVKRPCWYEPGDNAQDMLNRQQQVKDWWVHTNPDGDTDFDKFLEQYKDKVGKDGRWWTPAYNAADPDGLSCWTGLQGAVWVPAGGTPPGGITLQELYQLARAALTVPEPKINLSPDVKSYVNLPTWVWLTGIGPTSRSVTAEIPGVMSATVTATLGKLEIKPGTSPDRAQVTTTGCGGTGRPYAKAGDFTCGVTYLRASADQPRRTYVLTVTTVWPVTGGGLTFQPVQSTATRDVPVGEVQSIVRKD